MIGRRWVQAGGMAGIAAFIVTVASFSIQGNVPASSSSVAQITNYVTSHRSSVLAGTVLAVVIAALILWSAGTLARLVHARDEQSPLGMIALAAGAGIALILSLDGITLTALEFVSRQGGVVNPSLTRVLFELQNGIIMPGAFGCVAAVWLVAVGVAAVRGIFAAPWLGWLSFVFAALAAAGSLLGLTSLDGGTSVFGYLPAIGSGVILLFSSIFMVRESAAGTTPLQSGVAATSAG